MARFHLTPRRAMTSEGGILGKKDVASAKLTLVVDDVSVEKIRLRLTGLIHTGSAFDKDGFGKRRPVRSRPPCESSC
jgi:hypothetical protein